MDSILILGSEGGLGQFLIKSVHNYFPNSQVVRVSRSIENTEDDREVAYCGDLLDIDLVARIFREHRISHIVHCAAHWNGFNKDVDILYNNTLITLNVLKCLNDDVEKFVYVSSSAVYENANGCTEDLEQLKPTSAYGMSKLFCENSIKFHECDYDYTIWRPFHIVSPAEQYNKGVSHVCTDMAYSIIELNKPVHMDIKSASKRIGFAWVGDVADCIVSNIDNEKTRNEIFNIGTNDKNSIGRLVGEIVSGAQEMGLITSNFNQPTLETRHVDTIKGEFDKIFNVILWKPQTKFGECVRNFIAYKYCKK